MKRTFKKICVVVVTMLLIMYYINASFASELEDYKFVQMIEGLDRKTIETEKRNLKKTSL